jgi:hypothetical protein
MVEMGQFPYAPAHPIGHVERERRGRQLDGQRQDQRSGGRSRRRRGGDVEPCWPRLARLRLLDSFLEGLVD